VLDALDGRARVPTAAASSAELAPAVAQMPEGEQLSGLVVDVRTGRTLWSLDPQALMAPASTIKLLTAAAALDVLGPEHRLTTTTREVGHTVFLVGGGDPTLVPTATSALPATYPRPATLAVLAARTAAALPPGRPIRLRVDTSAWSGPTLAPGWSEDDVTDGNVTPPTALEIDGGRLHPADIDSPRTSDPATQAAAAFASLLRKDGVTIRGEVTLGGAPRTASLLATVASPPVAALVQRMLTISDNDLAEALGRATAAFEGRPATFEGAAAVVTREAETLGVPPFQLSLVDTSGLSHDDRVMPAALITVLRAAASRAHPALRPILEGLPVAGFTGTLAERYRSEDADVAGLVRAKTGTLTGVNSLAGLVVDRDGRLLAFALLASGRRPAESVQDGLDRIAAVLPGLG
jgi:D-alanyl-D-alanine carboxypeptidase/D-alanyl-D-alanine-endopeptidase (penicillin-binding protein 4)